MYLGVGTRQLSDTVTYIGNEALDPELNIFGNNRLDFANRIVLPKQLFTDDTHTYY